MTELEAQVAYLREALAKQEQALEDLAEIVHQHGNRLNTLWLEREARRKKAREQ